jgi:hypothetical protein
MVQELRKETRDPLEPLGIDRSPVHLQLILKWEFLHVPSS